MTWKQFTSKLLSKYQDDNLVMVSSVLELLLQEYLTTQKHEFLQPSHAHEILHLHQELWRHNQRNSAKENISAWLQNQWHLSEDGYLEIDQKMNQIFDFLDSFENHLAQMNLTSEAWRLTKAIGLFLETNESLGWAAPNERVIIAGLTSLPKAELKLFSFLIKSPSVEAWLDAPWKELASGASLRTLAAAAAPSFSDSKNLHSNVAVVHECQDPLGECLTAVTSIKSLLDQGVPSHRIVLAVPDESSYASALAHILSETKLKANVSLSRNWGESILGRWLQVYHEWLETRTSEAFAHLLHHPFSNFLLENNLECWRLLRKKSFCPESECLKILLDSPFQVHNPSSFVAKSPADQIKRASSEALGRVALEESWNFLSAWRDPANSDGFLPGSLQPWWNYFLLPHYKQFLSTSVQGADSAFEHSAFNALTQASGQLKQYEALAKTPIKSAAVFTKHLLQLAANLGARDVGEPLKDIQIISVTEARYVPCDALIIVGLAEGVFPRSLPKDLLVDDKLKAVAGMPGWAQLEALEETTFGLLCARVPHVELTYPLELGGKIINRSRWVERLVAKKIPLTISNTLELYLSVTKNSPSELTAKTNSDATALEAAVEPPNEGTVANLQNWMQGFSAKSIKSLMTCPFQYLAQKQNLRHLTFKKALDPRDVGILLHKIIEHTCTPLGDKITEIPATIAWRRDFKNAQDMEAWSLERLLFFTEHHLKQTEHGRSAKILEITHQGWSKLASNWGKLFEFGWNVADAKIELKLNQLSHSSTDALFENLSGSIDMFIKKNDGQSWAIFDFKSGRVPELRSVKNGLEPQLLVYALGLSSAEQDLRLESGVVGYWDLSQGELVEIGRGKGVDPIAFIPQGKTQSLEDLVFNFSAQWQARRQDVVQKNRFYLDSKNCGFCEFPNFCRKNDPAIQKALGSSKGNLLGE
jgi:hypothetical protein